jgi:Mg-chelatase subunit ChlD
VESFPNPDAGGKEDGKMHTFRLSAAAALIVGGSMALPSGASRAQCPEPSVTLPVSGAPRIEVVFVLDTTGSMSELIAAAKRKIWSIATAVSAAEPHPEIRMGLVAYRDRGDDYVTRSSALTSDLDRTYSSLLEFRADGGGDGPESVNQALHEAIASFSWSRDPRTLRLVFLVGDAPPHMDYGDDVPYPTSCGLARASGIIVNTVQCGNLNDTERVWREIAQQCAGVYLAIEPSAGARSLSTPYDEQLALHSRLLDGASVVYGGAKERTEAKLRRDRAHAIDKAAPAEALADRASYRATESGRKDAATGGDLVRDLARGSVRLDDIPEEQLPRVVRNMTPEQRVEYVDSMRERREGLLSEIRWLSKKRQDYLAARRGPAGDGFDRAVLEALRCQGRRVGLRFPEGAAVSP